MNYAVPIGIYIYINISSLFRNVMLPHALGNLHIVTILLINHLSNNTLKDSVYIKCKNEAYKISNVESLND